MADQNGWKESAGGIAQIIFAFVFVSLFAFLSLGPLVCLRTIWVFTCQIHFL